MVTISPENTEKIRFDISSGKLIGQTYFTLCKWLATFKFEGRTWQLIIANILFWIIAIIMLTLDIFIMVVLIFLIRTIIYEGGKWLLSMILEALIKAFGKIIAWLLIILLAIILIISISIILYYRFPVIKESILFIFDNK